MRTTFGYRTASTATEEAARGAKLAARTGYADRVHMTREFSDLAGLSPARWVAEEQAVETAFLASGD